MSAACRCRHDRKEHRRHYTVRNGLVETTYGPCTDCECEGFHEIRLRDRLLRMIGWDDESLVREFRRPDV